MQRYAYIRYFSPKSFVIGFFLLFSVWMQLQPVALADNTISGTVSLPGSDVAAQNISMYVQVWNPNTGEAHSESFQILAGNASFNYSITVPTDSLDNWRVHYECSSCIQHIEKLIQFLAKNDVLLLKFAG